MPMSLVDVDHALAPFEKILKKQERYRRRLGVREVDQPTYLRYITGNIVRFDRRRNAFAALKPENPWGEDFRQRFTRRTGLSKRKALPFEELDDAGKVGQALSQSAWRVCREYKPEINALTGPAGRLEVKDPAAMSELIKKAAMFFGAQLVRITEIDSRWTYDGCDIPHRYAIICVVHHCRSFTATAPSFPAGAAVGDVYSRLTVMTTQLADLIAQLGYPAQYRETRGFGPELLMVPLAIDAGVGEFARNGRCLSPEFGINMRMKAVTTDLPLKPDSPIAFSTHDFCMNCESCATYCPANAIPFGPPGDPPDGIFYNPGYRKWWTRADRCLTFWMANRHRWTSCGGRCIAVCPWNKPQNLFHNVMRWLAIHAPNPLKRGLVRADEIVYKRSRSIRKTENMSSGKGG